jgi:nitrogen fixation/metabolism regulation signal transduction histidine kinase
MFAYFIFVDVYAFVLVIIAALTPRNNIIIILYAMSFVICYILVTILSVKLHRIVKINFTNTTRRISAEDAKSRRQIVRAFFYQACTPLIFQTPQLLNTVLSMSAILFKLKLNVNPWLTVNVFSATLSSLTIALDPIADVFIVFYVMKPYRRALKSVFSVVLLRVKNLLPGISGSTGT